MHLAWPILPQKCFLGPKESPHSNTQQNSTEDASEVKTNVGKEHCWAVCKQGTCSCLQPHVLHSVQEPSLVWLSTEMHYAARAGQEHEEKEQQHVWLRNQGSATVLPALGTAPAEKQQAKGKLPCSPASQAGEACLLCHIPG